MLIKPVVLASAAVALLAAAGCGQEATGSAGVDASGSATASASSSTSASASVSPSGSPSTSASPSSSAAPASWKACGALWRDGATLPRAYPGCSQQGTAVAAERIGCSSGQQIVIYADHYFAVPGGTVARSARVLANSREYLKAIQTCRG